MKKYLQILSVVFLSIQLIFSQEIKNDSTTSRNDSAEIIEITNTESISKKALLISTNFNIPTVQYTPLKNDLLKKGEVSFFNAIGAGIGLSLSDIFQKTSKTNEIINTEVKNNIGIQIGFLFSSTSEDAINKSKFAYTMALQLLDFQLGWGHQFGEVSEKQYRNFFNLSYSIPLSKFTGAKYFQLRFKARNKNISYNERGGFIE